ncbi:hypothetical protein BH23CHL2_BH23CHL2_10250 [soil metagenome]
MTISHQQPLAGINELIGETYSFGPEWVTLKVTGEDTDDAYIVIEVLTPAQGGPPLHTHRAAEVFFVVEGTFEFPTVVDGVPHTVKAKAGESVHIPAGVPHSYKNIGDDYGRLIGVLTPAAEIEGFFREGLEPVADPSGQPTLDMEPDMARVMAASEKYNLRFMI